MQPDLSQLPTRPDWQCTQIDLDFEMSNIWSDSILISHGADAVLRCSHKGPFPVVKLAHLGKEFRIRVQHVFETIQDMTAAAPTLPIPEVDDHPQLDDKGVFGYRLEYLVQLENNELARRLPELREAVSQLHEAGFSHGDLSLSNIMKNGDGAIVLIDFGYAGKIGTRVPSSIPQWVYGNAVVGVEADERTLEQLWKLCEDFISTDVQM